LPKFKLDSRMSRAQRFALAGALAGLISCQDSDAHDNTGDGAGGSVDTGTGTGGTGTGTGGLNMVAFYGNACPPDGCMPPPSMGTGGAGAPADAGVDDAGKDDDDAGTA
jgi:hypothetical protein